MRAAGQALAAGTHQVGGGVLHAGNVLELEQALHGVDRHVDHRPGRDVVDDDRNADRVVDRLEVLIEPFLRRLVVVRRDREDAGREGDGEVRQDADQQRAEDRDDDPVHVDAGRREDVARGEVGEAADQREHRKDRAADEEPAPGLDPAAAYRLSDEEKTKLDELARREAEGGGTAAEFIQAR